MNIVFFHRNKNKGISINKVTQTIINEFLCKKEYYMPAEGSSPLCIIRNLLYIFRHRDKRCINHITGDIVYGAIALIGCKTVLTYHDTTAVDLYYGSKLKKWYRELLWYRIPLRIASKIVCISEETKKCLSRFTTRSDIYVIHNAVDNSITYTPRSYTCKEKYEVLIVGTAINKNINNTIEAMKDLPVNLLIIGNISREQLDLLHDSQITFENYINISDKEINALYGRSDLLSFCSFMEGFGMPVIEAQKSGCPVLCSNLKVLREVGGDGAIYVDPHSVQEIHLAAEKLLKSSLLREQLALKGLENVKRFSPQTIRLQWIEMYNDFK